VVSVVMTVFKIVQFLIFRITKITALRRCEVLRFEDAKYCGLKMRSIAVLRCEVLRFEDAKYCGLKMRSIAV
jgi:hypothetical protein